MLMHSNFDDPLELKDERTIVAKGPLLWGPGPGQCKIDAVITQGALRATGDTGNYNEKKGIWECDVQLPSGQHWDPTQTVDCEGTATPPPELTWDPQPNISLRS
jgi:hypothetical protein